MATVTVSTRLEEEECAVLDSLAEREFLDRGALIKSVLRRGIRDLSLKHAMESYQAGEITLSKASELTGLSLWDLHDHMGRNNICLNYGVEDLEDDLKTLETLRP